MHASCAHQPVRPRAARLSALLLIVAGAALSAVAAPSASAMTPPAPEPQPSPRISVERRGYADGTQPRFDARLAPLGTTAEVSWRICAPNCGGPVATGRDFQPVSLPIGATVQATAVIDGQYVGAQSETWWGPPTPTAPPGIAGELRIGRVVAPAPGRWVGGWQDDGSYFTYRLCRTAAGDDCRAFHPASGSNDRVTVDPTWAGWYLGTVEHRYGWGSAFAAIAHSGPSWGVLPGPEPLSFAVPPSVAGPLVGPIPAIRPATLPRVTGTLAAGRTVRARSGHWPDVPAGGGVRSGLRACPTRKDSDRCVAITDFARTADTPVIAGRPDRPTLDQPAKLDPRYVGWYVGAVDLYIPDLARSRMGLRVETPSDLRTFAIPAPSPVVIHGPLSRKPIRLGFTPRATIRTRSAVDAQRRTTLATVRCSGRCVARATVSSGGRTTRVRLVVRGGKRLTVPARATRGAQARVTIRFDHHPRIVRKTVRLT
ncbi:MAG: hypothetical protein WC558_05520 [Patulibacter sp.]